MMEVIIKIRNSVIGFLYKNALKPILFSFDPENVHDAFVRIGKVLGAFSITKVLTALMFQYRNPVLEQKVLGIKFKNPIGLAAGFDKNAELPGILPSVGFGFAEFGSVTGNPCAGNPKPRLWRLKESQGIVVHYGLKNDGCEKIAQKLKKKKIGFSYGISIAKTNCKATASRDAGIEDYVKAYKKLKEFGDYITINISCPNAYGGLPFTNKSDLSALLKSINQSKKIKPIFLKMAPDLTSQELDEIIEVAEKYNVDGFVCTNLTKDRNNKAMMKNIFEKELPKNGGISGKPVEGLSTSQIANIYKRTKGKFIIIGCGGVFTAEDAYKKIRAGASLIQLITGMLFGGPQTVSEINQGLTELLKRDGFKNISEAIGADYK